MGRNSTRCEAFLDSINLLPPQSATHHSPHPRHPRQTHPTLPKYRATSCTRVTTAWWDYLCVTLLAYYRIGSHAPHNIPPKGTKEVRCQHHRPGHGRTVTSTTPTRCPPPVGRPVPAPGGQTWPRNPTPAADFSLCIRYSYYSHTLHPWFTPRLHRRSSTQQDHPYRRQSHTASAAFSSHIVGYAQDHLTSELLLRTLFQGYCRLTRLSGRPTSFHLRTLRGLR